MDFDFLPNLPKSNLDDRTFKDLVEECIQRIPRYCPEWTNYNPSDPGITLIELFSWLTDQMLLRFNQVPRRNYVAFLELLGIRLQSPVPAQTELTFYLTTTLNDTYSIPAGIEVATVRTETEEAIVFSTDRPLTVGHPRLWHFLTSQVSEPAPQVLRDRFTGLWNQRPDGEWEGREQAIFSEQPQPGNCFYLVFSPDESIEGNVIALTLKGAAATTTGINPDFAPRRWEAWNGESWQPILLQEADDSTGGFSFNEFTQQGRNPAQGGDVILHLPQRWPVTQFVAYQGRWVRCTYTALRPNQPGYLNSPRIIGLGVRSIGGTVNANQSTLIRNELLGTSSGEPGQTFQLQGVPILDRREGEYILVVPPGGLPQTWQEVRDFADSRADDLHYVIDSLTGTVQFGPLIREPAQIRQQTEFRVRGYEPPRTDRSEPTQAGTLLASATDRDLGMEQQYGAVPPRGSVIRMVAYRTGGGQRGNVQAGKLKVMKSSVPYVARVINHVSAFNGADAESLEHAAIRAPRMLRTRDRAVTREDFETLALQAGRGAVARAICLANAPDAQPGTVNLLIVPQANLDAITRSEGIHPDQFILNPQLQERILGYLDDRKLLGVQVRLLTPEYVGVAVQTEVALEPEYNNPRARQEILTQLRISLYRFFNPLIGGSDGKGWTFGRPVYPSDVVTLFQRVPGVRYLGVVQLFELRKRDQDWVRTLPPDPVINPGPLGLVCSWTDPQLRSSHVINFIDN